MKDSIGEIKLNEAGLRRVLNTGAGREAITNLLKESGDSIAESMTSEGHGEFEASVGRRGYFTRAHVFVNPADDEATATANADPAIFARHIDAGQQAD